MKHRRLVEVLDRHGLDAVLLRSPAAVNWYLDGARTHVSLAAAPLLAVRVDRVGGQVLVSRAEAKRLRAEELPAGVEVHELDWWDDAARGGGDALPEAEIDAELRALRTGMLPGEIGRFRTLGRETAAITTDAMRQAHPAMTERELAALVTAGLAAAGIDPLVVLVGGQARLAYRHPLATDSLLGDRAMVVVCGRRHGLVANLSRWVRATPENKEERERTRRIRAVEAAYWHALTDGARLADVLAAGIAAYGLAGFDPDEWMQHHQGGVAGYDGRDPRASPPVVDLVRSPEAFAWNPTAPGAKVEDTVLFADGDVEILTVDPRWPTSDHDGRARPDEWVMGEPSGRAEP